MRRPWIGCGPPIGHALPAESSFECGVAAFGRMHRGLGAPDDRRKKKQATGESGEKKAQAPFDAVKRMRPRSAVAAMLSLGANLECNGHEGRSGWCASRIKIRSIVREVT